MSLESYYRGELERERDKVAKLREALEKIRDCTWHKGAFIEECGAISMADEALADTEEA